MKHFAMTLILISTFFVLPLMGKSKLLTSNITEDEIETLYGKRTKFKANKFNKSDFNKIIASYKNTIRLDKRLSKDERDKKIDEIKNELEFEDDKFFGLKIQSTIEFNSDELAFAVDLLKSEKSIESEKVFIPVELIIASGSVTTVVYYYYFIVKTNESVSFDDEDITLKVTFPNSKNQVYSISD